MQHDHPFCSACGSRYTDMSWPRRCTACGVERWQNAIPVVVLIQPVDNGVLLARRNIEPNKGKLAFPSGFVEIEDWTAGLAREAKEEIGLDIDPRTLSIYDVISTPDGKMVLLFALAPWIAREALDCFVPNEETSELVVAEHVPDDIAFPIHRDILDRYLGFLHV